MILSIYFTESDLKSCMWANMKCNLDGVRLYSNARLEQLKGPGNPPLRYPVGAFLLNNKTDRE